MDKLNKMIENENKIKEIDSEINYIFINAQGGYDPEEDEDDDEYQRMCSDPNFQASILEGQKKKLLLENRKYRAEIEQEELNKNFEIISKTFKSGLVASDNESTLDTLSREMYAKILVRHIVRKEVETPINIGVFGDWGEGKSSFLKLMEKEVKYLNEKKYMHTCYTHVVRYDASEYDEKNKIWASILSSLFEEFEKNRGSFGKLKYTYNGIIKSLKVNKLKYIINGLVLLITTAWLVYFGTADSPIKKIKDSFLGVVGIVPLIMFVTNLLIPFIKQQLAFIQPLSSRVLSFIKLPDYKQELGSRENIKSTLKDLLKVWIEGRNERIVLFIDELDRCSEKVISEFFNALQLLLSVKGITVVLSVNYKTVCYSLASNNKFYFESATISNEEKIEFGVDYLKKYINIPIHLPRTCKYEEYITDIIVKTNNDSSLLVDGDDSNDGEQVNITAETESHAKVFNDQEEILIRNILKWINIQKHLTPREVKNIINILVISKEVIIIKNKKTSPEKTINFKRFIKWFFFHYFNRTSASKLIQKIQNSKEEFKYNTIEESIKEEALDCVSDNEIMAKKMIKVLNDIRGDEAILFKEISAWFISDNESLKE